MFVQMFLPAGDYRVDSAFFPAYAPAPLRDAAVPPFPAREEDEEEEAFEAPGRDLGFECPPDEWQPIGPSEPFGSIPVRFVDGSIQSRTVASLRVGGRQRPVIAATISAAALRLDGRSLGREAGAKTLKTLCVNSNGIAAGDLLAAERVLGGLGVRLLTSEAEEPSSFDSMRRSARQVAMNAMEELERDVMLSASETPTLVDGLLERRLAAQRQDIPVFGLVKRQIANYLPVGLQEIVYRLKPGERSPLFVLETVQRVTIVNTYLRLSAPPGASPSYGVVRLTAPLEFVTRCLDGESVTPFFSGLAACLYGLRQRDYGYARAGISVEPIVRVEEHLHAILPSIEVLVEKVHRLIGRGGGEER